MKKLTILLLAVSAIACNNASTNTKADAAKDAPVKYAYTIDHPDNWEIGSQANTALALNALKLWEDSKMDECVKNFGDSTKVSFDALDKKLGRDSLKAMFIGARNNYKNLSISMKDWESVISKDKKEAWVTVWYVQKFDDSKGGKDSVSIVNDMEIKNGKIVQLVEYTRKFH